MKQLPNHKKIMIIISENCNLRCNYCYEQNKNSRSMTFDAAKKILDKCYSEMDGYESMVIELHGGEPFLEFALIKQIDEYVMEQYGHIPVLFRSITNGTMVHGEIQKWLSERKDRYEIMLSIDGKQQQHDENRRTAGGRGSFELIDLAFFRDTWKHCPVSMTVNERTLPFLAEGTIFLQENSFDCCNAFEWAVDWNLDKSVPILARELRKLVQWYTDHPDQQVCLLVRYHLKDFFDEITDRYRYCIDIDDPLECYDALGRYAPCHGFTAFTMGSEEKAKEFACLTTKDFVFERDNLCYGCRLIRFCRVCFAANHMLTGDCQKQSPEICLFNRMCIKAGIEIQRNRIHKKEEIEKNSLETLKAADAIENYLEKLEDRLTK